MPEGKQSQGIYNRMTYLLAILGRYYPYHLIGILST